MGKKAYKRVIPFFRGMSKAYITSYASSGAFFLFLSVFPMVLLACSVLRYTSLTQDNLALYLESLLPPIVSEFIREIIDQVYESSFTTISLSAILVLWSASKAFMGLLHGLNSIFGANPPANYFRLRARSGACTLLLLIVIVVSLLLIIFEQRLMNATVMLWPSSSFIVEFIINFRFLMIIALLSLVFILIYKWMPYKKMKVVRQIPGAVLAAVLWLFLSWFFSIYVRNFGTMSIYGSLATIILAVLWMYYCMYIILFGAYLNAWFENKAEAAEYSNIEKTQV